MNETSDLVAGFVGVMALVAAIGVLLLWCGGKGKL